MKTIKRIFVPTVTVVCLLFLFFAFLINQHKRYVESVRPLQNTTLDVFFARQPNPLKVFKFTYQGGMYVYVVGNAPNFFLNAPSGPPAYIFDATGMLVDWRPDIAEGKPFAHEWGTNRTNSFISPDTSTAISVEEAKQLVTH